MRHPDDVGFPAGQYELYGACQKGIWPMECCWSVAMRFTLSETMSGWVLWTKERPHEHQSQGIPTGTLYCSYAQYHALLPTVVIMSWLIHVYVGFALSVSSAS